MPGAGRGASGTRIVLRPRPGTTSAGPTRPAGRAPNPAPAQLPPPPAAPNSGGGGAGPRHKKPAAPAPPLPIDAGVDRVIRAYQAAMQADPTSPAPVEEIIRFGRRVGRLDAAEAGVKEMVRRKKERETAEPLSRHADFLAARK